MKKALLCSLIMLLLAGSDCFAQGFSAGARFWHANWDLEYDSDKELDPGAELYTLIYLGFHYGPGNIIVQVGTGKGWDLSDDLIRTEISLAGTLTSAELIDPLIVNCGLSVRNTSFSFDDEDWSYTGLELLLGAVLPLGQSGFAVSTSGSVGLYDLSYDSDTTDLSGDAFGFTLDGGLIHNFDLVQVSLGYRLQEVENDGSKFPKEIYQGLYLGAGFGW